MNLFVKLNWLNDLLNMNYDELNWIWFIWLYWYNELIEYKFELINDELNYVYVIVLIWLNEFCLFVELIKWWI